jgi:hypothetical protein
MTTKTSLAIELMMQWLEIVKLIMPSKIFYILTSKEGIVLDG